MLAVLQGAAKGQLRSADLSLKPGRYVVLANESETVQPLVGLLAGCEQPERGSILIDGSSPASSPALRRQIAALLAEEALPPAKTVLGAVGCVLTARGCAEAAAMDLLTTAGLGHLAALRPHLLDQRTLRGVALALALAHGTARLVALHEPLATILPRSFVLSGLDRLTERGAIVVSTTVSAADATLLGGQWLCVELGRLRMSEGVTPRLGSGPWQQVLVESKDARALALLLQESPGGWSSELAATADTLRITGPALDITVRAIVALARQHQLEVRRIEAAVPPVEALMAARGGFARGAYEAARTAAVGAATRTPDGVPWRPT